MRIVVGPAGPEGSSVAAPHSRRPPWAPNAGKSCVSDDAPVGRVDDRGVLSSGPVTISLPGRVEEDVRVEAEALSSPTFWIEPTPSMFGDGVKTSMSGLLLSPHALRLLVEAGDDDDAAVAELGEGRVPAPVLHVGLDGPGLVEGVEGEDHVVALVLRVGVARSSAGCRRPRARGRRAAWVWPAHQRLKGRPVRRVGRRVAADAGAGGGVEDVGLGPVVARAAPRFAGRPGCSRRRKLGFCG